MGNERINGCLYSRGRPLDALFARSSSQRSIACVSQVDPFILKIQIPKIVFGFSLGLLQAASVV